MIRPVLRHWVVLDLGVLRPWLTDLRIQHAELIDNHDGTFGRAFELQLLEPAAFIACSETMSIALERGIRAVPPLPTGPERTLRSAPSLQDLVARHGGHDRITPAAWAQYEAEVKRWRDDVRYGQAEIIPKTRAKEDDAA